MSGCAVRPKPLPPPKTKKTGVIVEKLRPLDRATFITAYLAAWPLSCLNTKDS